MAALASMFFVLLVTVSDSEGTRISFIGFFALFSTFALLRITQDWKLAGWARGLVALVNFALSAGLAYLITVVVS